jgi:hypothetical protein
MVATVGLRSRHPVALYKLAPVQLKTARIVPRHAVAPTANISRRTATIFFSLSGSRESEANPVPWLCGINRELMSPPSERKSKWFIGGSSCNKASSFAYEFDGNRVRIFDKTSAKGPPAHRTAKIHRLIHARTAGSKKMVWLWIFRTRTLSESAIHWAVEYSIEFSSPKLRQNGPRLKECIGRI